MEDYKDFIICSSEKRIYYYYISKIYLFSYQERLRKDSPFPLLLEKLSKLIDNIQKDFTSGQTKPSYNDYAAFIQIKEFWTKLFSNYGSSDISILNVSQKYINRLNKKYMFTDGKPEQRCIRLKRKNKSTSEVIKLLTDFIMFIFNKSPIFDVETMFIFNFLKKYLETGNEDYLKLYEKNKLDVCYVHVLWLPVKDKKGNIIDVVANKPQDKFTYFLNLYKESIKYDSGYIF